MARILIVGGSLGGLMAANLLHRAGHDVLVLERSARSLEGRGAGIVTHASLLQALHQAGATVDDTLGVKVSTRVVLAPDGRTECRWDYPQILTSWGRLYALLREALPDACHRLGAAVATFDQRGDSVSATLVDGTQVDGELLIACDGIRSTVRTQLAPDVQPAYANYVAWRGVCDEALLSQHTRRTLFEHFGFGIPEHEQMIGYPVAGAGNRTTVGQRRWNFVWYRPAAAGPELAALMTDADGTHHEAGIPPNQVSWRAVAAMREAARQLLAPQFAEIVEKTALPFLQPIYDLVSPTLAFDRVALLGDAALVARPHVGMGVSKAGEDAVALAACIATDGATPRALARYAAQRQPESLAVVERGRWLGRYLEAKHRGDSVTRSAETVMHETAVDTSLFESATPRARALA
ncbi:MAG: FAD binding domain-containing protein [Pseudomonadota bacterium]|nr:FAD binding domain-containing protein [Pseudomonadota bacterium]